MDRCPSCEKPIDPSSRFCSSCGAEIVRTITSPNVTATETDQWIRPALDKGTVSRSDPWASRSGDHGRFLPGTMLTKRYRIVSLLGKGGMGEVYRADDLELAHPVALKFLPAIRNCPDFPSTSLFKDELLGA